jgi:diacylglycerol O-acyltransferase
MERMSALDAEFLHMEDGVNHMHIGSCALFEGPPPTEAEAAALYRAALPGIHRYRQVARFVPLNLGRPVWVDAPDFDLGDHLFHTTLPAPGDDRRLAERMAAIMSTELDRRHPLWEAWIVHGLPDGRWALISKVHHCMVDGLAGNDLLQVLLDTEPEPSPAGPDHWTPEPQPSDTRLVLDAAGDLATTLAGAARDAVGLLARPAETARRVRDLAGGLAGFGSGLRATPETSIDGSIGPGRRWVGASAPLDDAKAVRKALGGTVNDVILAAVTRGFRDLMRSRGEDPDHTELRTMIPVSIRALGGDAGNEVVALLARLPVHLTDPAERYAAVRAEVDRLKESHEVEVGETVTSLANLAPPPIMAAVTRVFARVLRDRGQRNVNTVTTNVPGPQFPLYAAGRRMLTYYPYVPVALGVRVTVAIVSYDGGLYFGVTGDRETAPDIGVLADGIDAGMAELVALTG